MLVQSYKPSKVEIRLAIQIQLILEHLVYGIGWCTLMWDLELGDLLLGSIARRIWSSLANTSFAMNVTLACFMGVIMKSLDDLIWIYLYTVLACVVN